jgi:hypothetical protein
MVHVYFNKKIDNKNKEGRSYGKYNLKLTVRKLTCRRILFMAILIMCGLGLPKFIASISQHLSNKDTEVMGIPKERYPSGLTSYQSGQAIHIFYKEYV